ncbi:hypothetical protein AX774_g7854, partial [Zancudomyces culisetae]
QLHVYSKSLTIAGFMPGAEPQVLADHSLANALLPQVVAGSAIFRPAVAVNANANANSTATATANAIAALHYQFPILEYLPDPDRLNTETERDARRKRRRQAFTSSSSRKSVLVAPDREPIRTFRTALVLPPNQASILAIYRGLGYSLYRNPAVGSSTGIGIGIGIGAGIGSSISAFTSTSASASASASVSAIGVGTSSNYHYPYSIFSGGLGESFLSAKSSHNLSSASKQVLYSADSTHALASLSEEDYKIFKSLPIVKNPRSRGRPSNLEKLLRDAELEYIRRNNIHIPYLEKFPLVTRHYLRVVDAGAPTSIFFPTSGGPTTTTTTSTSASASASASASSSASSSTIPTQETNTASSDGGSTAISTTSHTHTAVHASGSGDFQPKWSCSQCGKLATQTSLIRLGYDGHHSLCDECGLKYLQSLGG